MKHTLYDTELSAASSPEMLLQVLGADAAPESAVLLAQALDLALAARQDPGQRPRGIDTALILKNLRVDDASVIAALLADPWLRENHGEQAIREQFGDDIGELVRKVNWLNTFEYTDEALGSPQQTELLRRMLLAVVRDLRPVLIKLVYRLQRLRLLVHADTETRTRVAEETLELFAPLANRLGIAQLKWELEDLSFRYLQPAIYRGIANALAERRSERERFLNGFIAELSQRLAEHGIRARVYGRPKHIYSIWQKLQRKNLPLSDLYDLRAVRVIVEDRATCYTVLGIVHDCWVHVPKEFDDYITRPKDNGYQSLHTVVIGPQGKLVEVQIRTQAMHLYAEYGVAAHWRYKEGGKTDPAFDQSIASLRRLLENRGDDPDLLEQFKAEIDSDRVFVLTPKGQILSLTQGATPLDFAYAIHSEVGHRCRGAKVNGRIVPLTYTLRSGEQVEIITARQGGPSRNWLDPHLGYVHTSHARNKIKQYFSQENQEDKLRQGRILLERAAARLGLKEVDLKELARHFHVQSTDELLTQIAKTEIGSRQLANALWQTARVTVKPPPASQPPPRSREIAEQGDGQVHVSGIGRLTPHFSRCCKPTPDDAIMGYLSSHGRVSIHRRDCSNLLRLAAGNGARLLEVSWGEEPVTFPVDLEVRAHDRKGLLRDITQAVLQEKGNILATNSQTDPADQRVVMRLKIAVSEAAQIDAMIDRIEWLHNVSSVQRVG